MTDLVRLGLVVDSQGFVRAKRDMDSFKKSASDVTNETDKTTSSMDRANKIAAAFGKTIGLIAVSLATGALAKYTNQWTDLNSRLINATGSAEDAQLAMEAISETARRTYSSLEETAQGFLQNNLVLKQLGYSTKEQLDLMEALNNSMVISGAKGQDAALVMGAFGRAMAQGKLAGQELNLIMNYSSRSVEALADGLGVTVIELREMAAAGEITADRLYKAFVSQMDPLAKEADAMAATIGDSFIIVGNSVLELIGSLDEVAGISGKVSSAIIGMADSVRDFAGDTDALAKAIGLTADAIEAIALVMGARFLSSIIESRLETIRATAITNAHSAALVENARVNFVAAQAEVARTAAMVKATAAQAVDTASIARATAAQAAHTAAVARSSAASTAFVGASAAVGSAATLASRGVGLLRGGMALLGGPAGLLVIGAYGAYKLANAYMDYSAEAKKADSASRLAALGVSLTNDRAAELATTLEDKTTPALRSYIAAGGAVAGLSLQMLKDTVTSMKETATANTEAAESYQKVIDALKDELKFVTMSARQKEIYQAIQRAGVALGSEEAAQIERLIDQRYDEIEALEDYEKAIENVKDQLAEMFELEDRPYKARDAIIGNIDVLAREYTALQQGTEAHKALTRELAIEAAMREAVAQGIIQEADPAYRQLIETQYDLANAVSEFKDQADPFAESWQAALERVDSAFVDLWKSAFTGFKGFADTLKNAFIQLLAELAHRATTQKIMISLGLGEAGVGGDILGKIPGFSSLTKNTGLDDILKGLGKGEGGFDKTALLDGFKQMGLTIAASWTGGKIGTAIGEGLFNKQAESNIGQTIGSTIGAIWGPWGALAGSALGSFVDTMTGGDGYKRQNAGFLVGNTPGAKPEYTFDVEDFASGLKVQGFARREDQQVARQVIEGFRELDAMVVMAGQSLGGFVDQLKITGLNEEATSGSLGTFLGLGRDADLPAQMKAYVDQLISSFGGLDQSIVDLVKNASSAEDALRVLGDATRLMQIQQLTSGMNAVQQAREQFNAQTSLTYVYQAATDQLRQLSMGYTGTIEQTAQLADAMVYQQEATYNLALAYMQVQSSVDSLFGGLSENIRMSLMSEQELYEYQRAQIEALSASINMMTDPEMIMGTAERIEAQLSQVWGRLDEEQRKAMGPEFLQFIDQTNAIAQDKLRQGLASVEVTQEDINRTIQQGIESAATQMGLAAAVQMQAAQMQMQAASVWADAANNRREANA